MNNIQLNIVANAQFQQVYAEVTKLKEAMASLQKVSVGGPFAPGIAAEIKGAQSAFDSAIQSTRAFTIQHVAMTDSVTKFGKQLEAGKLSLNQYYKIWRDNVNGVSKELDVLSQQQARINRSVAIADPLRPGYAKLVTDINGVVTAQEKAIFYQKALNTALHDGSMKLIDFGKNTQWMGRQLTVGLTMPIAMFGASIATAFNTVDKELTRMQKVYGTGLIQPTQAALKQIRTDVQALGNELARTLGTSMQDTAAMAADLAATGLEGSKLLNATKESLRLATLGELDHQQAMQATVSLQNVYKLSTQGLSEAVNFLNAVENQTSTSLQDLVDAIPRVGPIVQQLGGSFKDTAAMMVAMKEAGVPAAQGANAIKSALSSLINPTKNAQTAFKQYNIDLQSIATKTGGAPIQMLKALADQMKNLDRLSQAQLIEKMFGKFQFARVQALLDNINKAGSQTQTVFNLMGASTTELATLASNELKTQTESASGQFKRMIETVKADLLPMGEAFLNSFTRIGNIVDKVLKMFQNLSHILGPVAGLLGKVFGGGFAGLVLIGPILMLTGLFANLIGNLMKGANYIRMFRQGMEQASETQSKFAAGVQNLRNFYENLDLGMVAARRQLDLMPEAITSNAKAFDILNASIRQLTLQFESLAAAQAAAAGMPMGGAKSPLTHLPKMATGGIVPGTGNKDTYAAMLTPGETVIPKAQSSKYGSLINSIISNKVPGYSKGLFATDAGDFMDVTVQKLHIFSEQSGGILSALTSVYERLIGPARRLERIDTSTAGALMGGTARLNQLTRRGAGGATGEEVLQELRLFPQLTGKGGEKLDPMALMKKVASRIMPDGTDQVETDRKLDAAYQKLIDRVERRAKAEERLARMQDRAPRKIFGSNPGQQSFESFTESVMRRELGGIQTAVPGASGQMSLPDVFANVVATRGQQYRGTGSERELRQGTGETFWRNPNGELIPYSQSIMKTGFGVPEAAISTLSGSVPGSFGTGEAETYAESLGKRLIKRVRRAVRANSDSQEAILVSKDIDSGLAHGLEKHAPMVTTSASQLMTAVQQELELKLPAITGSVERGFNKKVFIPLEELSLAAGRKAGSNLTSGFSQMSLPGIGTQTFLGMPGLRPGMNPAPLGPLSRLKNAASNPMAMMGMGMLAPMAISMVPSQIGGKDLSGAQSTAQSAIAMGSTAAMVLQFSKFAGMAGPVGLAVGGLTAALGGLQLAFKNSDEAAKQASDAIVKNYQSAADQINSYRITDSSALKTQIQMQDVQLKTYDKLSDSQKKATSSADKLTQAYDNISKASTLQKQILAGQALGTAQSQGANSLSNQIRGLIFGRTSESNISNIAHLGLGALMPSLKAKDTGYYQSLGQSQLLKQLTSKPTSYEELVSPTYLANLDKGKTKLDAFAQALLGSRESFGLWNKEVSLSNPALAKLNEQLDKNGTSLQNIIQLNQAFAAGFFQSTNAIDWASTHLDQFRTAFATYQDKIKADVEKAKAQLSADQAKADELNKIAQGDTFTKDDEIAVKANEKKIKTIQDEVKKRDELYNAQMRNIEAQQQQMNLEADVVKARGSGNLLQMAVAQQNLNIQKTKDAMANAKANADRSSQNKIDALQAEIDKLNAKKSGTASVEQKAAAAAANAKVQKDLEALAAAQIGQGPEAKKFADAFDISHRTLPTPADKPVIPVIPELMPKWLKEFKWPEFLKPKWLEGFKWPEFLKPEWVKNIKWPEFLKPKWLEGFKWPEFTEPKWLVGLKEWFGKLKWPEIKVPAALESIFDTGKGILKKISAPITAAKKVLSKPTSILKKVAKGTVGKVVAKTTKVLGPVGAALSTWDAFQNAQKTGKFSATELGKSTAISAGAGAVVGSVVPGAGTTAGALSGGAWGFGTDLAGQLLGLLLSGGKGNSTKTTKVENKGKVENTNSGKIDNKSTGEQTNTNAGNHKTTNSGNHTTTNTGSHTTTNSGSHKTTNSGAHTTTNSGAHKTTNSGAHTTTNSGAHKTTNSGNHTVSNTGHHTVTNTGASNTTVKGSSSIAANNSTIVGPVTIAHLSVAVSTTVVAPDPVKKARGGIIHAATGLLIGAGTGTSDSIPAMLSNGEYVVNAGSVTKYGTAFMDAINNKTYKVPSSLGSFATASISDAVNSSTSVGGNVINLFPPQGSDSNHIANLVLTKLNQAASKQQTRRTV